MSRKGKMGRTKTVGYGFVGRWSDGTLGWCMPEHLAVARTEPPARIFNTNGQPDDRAVLCRVTVEQVFDSNRRPIQRKAKK